MFVGMFAAGVIHTMFCYYAVLFPGILTQTAYRQIIMHIDYQHVRSEEKLHNML